MHLSHYNYKTNESFLDFEFISEGPKGRIRKVVRFSVIQKDVYNLGFGDLDEVSGEISDTTITNNKDSQKVLATVALVVNDFTFQYPTCYVFAMGSTPARTRLYRMGITNNWHTISKQFDVYGLKNNNWEPFTFRKDYDAFLIRRK